MAQSIYVDTHDLPSANEEPGGGWRRLRFIVGGLVVLLAIGYLVATNLQQTGVYYLTVSEFDAQSASYMGRDIRLAGSVVPGSIQRDNEAMLVRFDAGEGGATVPVSYRGVVPDIFGDNIDVVVEGKMESDGVFYANTLLAKCPSRFEAELHPDQSAGSAIGQ